MWPMAQLTLSGRHHASPAHRGSSEEAGVGIDLVRLSCGIENTADIIADLDQALAAVQ